MKGPNNNKWRELIYKRFGKLIVADVLYYEKKRWFMHCICDCGRNTKVERCSLISGNTRSCGCLNIKQVTQLGKQNKTHGMIHTPEYRSWSLAKSRCLNPKCKDYPNYGGRGVKMCRRWKNSFEAFYEDMRSKPKPKRDYSLDRINNDGNYEPENCRWVKRKEQNNNKRNVKEITFRGKTQTISQWAEELNIKKDTLYARLITYKWSMEKAFIQPVRKIKI